MTYSVCISEAGVHGVATATKAPVVGSLGPFCSRNGVVCTQSIVNARLGAQATQSLDDGTGIDETVERLLADDEHASLRQVHGVDRWGNRIAVTGADCVGWAGDRTGDGYTLAGNMLEGPAVLDAMETGLEETRSAPPVERLLAVLAAGADAGGDKRGPRPESAAVRVVHPTEPRLFHDLRVDSHDTPIAELERLYSVTEATDTEWREEYPETVYRRLP